MRMHNNAFVMHTFVPHRSLAPGQLLLRAWGCIAMAPFCIDATFSSAC